MSTDKKHIVFVTPGFADGEADTSCIPAMQDYLLALLQAKPANWILHIIALQYPYEEQVYEWNGITVSALGGKNKWYAKGAVRKALYKGLNILKANQKIDLIHSFWLDDATLMAHKWAQENEVPLIATAMGQDVLSKNKTLRKLPLKEMEIIGLTSFHERHYKETTGFSCNQIIPWGLNGNVGYEGEKDIDLIGVGNLIPLKKFDQWLEVFDRLQKEHGSIKGVLVGDGPERAAYERMVMESNLNVEFAGHLTREEARRFIARSKVMYHPAAFESFGMVMIEALMEGTGVVANKVGIARDHEMIIEAVSVNEAVERINYMLRHPEENPVDFVSTLKTVISYLECYKNKL